MIENEIIAIYEKHPTILPVAWPCCTTKGMITLEGMYDRIPLEVELEGEARLMRWLVDNRYRPQIDTTGHSYFYFILYHKDDRECRTGRHQTILGALSEAITTIQEQQQ